MKTAKFFARICVFVGVTALYLVKSQAAEQFTTEYKIFYDTNDAGETKVSQTIVITNQKDDVIATNYSLNIKQLNIYDISAYDKNGELDVKEQTGEDGHVITVRLRSYIIGSGRQNEFTLDYKTKDIAGKVGEIWNITIPRTQILDSTTSYNLGIKVPDSFGPKILISPTPVNEKYEDGNKILYFNKDTIMDKNITASFGKFQILNFRLRYQLYNPNLFSGKYEIAMPSDIKDYQQIKYSDLQPFPEKIYKDKDGNNIAVYTVKPKQEVDVVVTGSAKLYGKQINIESGKAISAINKKIIGAYTKTQKYWESKNPEIQKIANVLINKEDNVSKNAKKIYEYLITNYDYDFGDIQNGYTTRRGAALAINDKTKWACMEFTDTFIAIARAMGIPARETNGYAISNSERTKPLAINLKGGDFLHSWPQYYDAAFGWVQVDPTWGDTSNADYFSKLDTNHFAFVTKGLNSEYPLPAGTYRTSDTDTLVEVDFSQKEQQPDFLPEFVVKKVTNLNIFELLKGNQKYEIINSSGIEIHLSDTKSILPFGKGYTYAKKGTSLLYFYNPNGEVFDKALNDL